MIGGHLIKHWSSTQQTVTLNSGEAELYGVGKGATEALGIRSLAQDMGIGQNLQISLYAGSSAAIGIGRPTGIGKDIHLATGQMWIQEKIRQKDISWYKVLGTESLADLFTKHVLGESVDAYLDTMHTNRSEGRAETAPILQGY